MPRCSGTTRKGKQCARMVAKGCECYQHKTPIDCPICFEVINKKDVVITQCNHIFHHACMLQWLKTQNYLCPQNYSCPCCRGDLKISREYINVYEDHVDVINWIQKSGYHTTSTKLSDYIIDDIMSDYPLSIIMTNTWHLSYVNKVVETSARFVARENKIIYEDYN